MSKTIEAVSLVVLGAAAATVGALVPGAQFLVGLGISTALAGVGIALRPSPPLGGPATTLSFSNGPAPRRVIYGQFETAGVLTYASFPPVSNQATTAQYLHLVYTLCAHEISSFDGLSINGTPYNFGTDLVYGEPAGADDLWHIYPTTSLTGVGFTDFYWQHAFFEFDFGRDVNTQPFPNLAAADPSWTSACVQQNCAKVHVILRADSGIAALYQDGAIPNIKFLVTGKKLIDPRVTTAWQASTGYLEYNWILDNRGILWVQQNSSGVSGATRPNFESYSSWPATVSDGSCSWKTYGFGQAAISAGTDGYPQGHIVNGRLVNDAWAPGGGYYSGYVLEAPLGYLQMGTNTGTVGSTEPAFSTTLGGTTTDNTQDWVCLGRSWHAINPSNPALIVNDYLCDPDFGMNANELTAGTAVTPQNGVIADASSVIAAANICEEQALIVWNADSSVVYENLYNCNGTFDFSSTRGDVLNALVASMAGWVVPPGDMWHIFAGSYIAPTVTLADIDMRGAMKGDFRLSRREAANSVRGKFTPAYMPPNPAAVVSLTVLPGIWQPQPYPSYQANGLAGKPDYLNSEDGGQIIWMDLDLDFVTSIWQAQRLAKIALMKTRFQERLHLQCKLSAFQLEAGDTFELTHANWSMSAATFWVQQSSLTLDDSKNDKDDQSPAIGVDLVAWQTDPSIYEFQGPTSSSDYGEYSPYGITGVMTGVE
jgi:hypothetical protein